ncbi:MAG: MFS transporter [Bacteroidetes bacterium]|nr:MFS transporter [Bacteroidota bacterium]
MNQPTRQKSPLGVIFLTVFLDMLGIGIIIPVIPALFFETSNDFFAATVGYDTRSILYGLLIACYPIMQFFGAPVLGSLSDRHGRKPVLSVALVGTMIGYLLFGVAILYQNIWLLFFSRMLPGFTGGNISIAMSSISDVSTPETRTQNFGLVGAAFGIGFIIGPALGGVLADSSIISWFDSSTPFWFTALLTLINLILVRVNFDETNHNLTDSKISPWTGIQNIIFSFQTPQLRAIFTVVLLLSLGFTFFTQFFSVRLIDHFKFTEKDIGLLFGWIGIWIALTQGGLVRVLSNRVSPFVILSIAPLALGLLIGADLIAEELWLLYTINPLIGVAQGVITPNLTTVVSEQADARQQGRILGINQSMQALGQVIPPLVGGYLNTLNRSFPLLAGSLLIVFAWVIFMLIFRGKAKPEVN